MSKTYTALLGHSLFSEVINRRPRREQFFKAMQELEQKGINCFKCRGTCCTFEANSMRIDRVEGADLLLYLIENNLLSEALIQHMEETIKRYRLDQELPGNGQRSLSRRLYTCPFYQENSDSFNCLIAREYRPYGCLAFNPLVSEQTDGGQCATGEFEAIKSDVKEAIPVMVMSLLSELKKGLAN